MRLRVFLLFLALAAVTSARADEPPEPTYADKPASWWIGEYLAGSDPEAAHRVLQKMGEAAAPLVAARLASAEKSADRLKLLMLLESGKKVPATVIAALRPSLASADGRERSSALRIVALAGAAAGDLAGDVAALLQSPDSDVRQSAARALAALGDAAVPHVPSLVALLAQPDEREVLQYVVALGRLGPRAAPALPSMLEFAAARPPNHLAVRALASVAPDDGRVADEIVRGVEKGDSLTRVNVNELLIAEGPAGDAIVAAATRLADSKDPELRRVAARALGRRAASETPVPERLYALLSDADVGVCGNVAQALEQRAARDRSIAGRVVEQWRITPHPSAETQLMLALLPDSGPALLDAALGDHEERRQAAWHVLVRAGERKVAATADQLTRMVLDARVPLQQRREFLGRVLSLRLVDDGTSCDVCAIVATKADAVLASEAISVLAGDSARRTALLSAAARPEPEVRVAAIRGMYALFEKHDDVRAACIAALDDAEAAVRAASLQVLHGYDGRDWTGDAATRDAVAAKLVAAAGRAFAERSSAIAILARFPDADRPSDALVAMLAQDDTADEVVGLLTRTPKCTAAVLQPALDGTDPVVAARATRVLVVRRGAVPPVERIARWIESDDPRVAREGALAAGTLSADGIVQVGGALIRAARAGVAGVAWPACYALGRIANSEPAAREALLAVADDAKNSAQLAVSQCLSDLGEEGIRRLIALLDHPKRDARRNACLQIGSEVRNGRTGYAGAIPALERIAKGDDLELARFAQDALKLLQK